MALMLSVIMYNRLLTLALVALGVERTPTPTAVVVAGALVLPNPCVAGIAVEGVSWVVAWCGHAPQVIGHNVQR